MGNYESDVVQKIKCVIHFLNIPFPKFKEQKIAIRFSLRGYTTGEFSKNRNFCIGLKITLNPIK